jgi:hypothetical protein
MASDKQQQKPFFLFRPAFVMLCLYIAAYAWLRSSNEIAVQSVALPSPRGTEVFRMIGASPETPHWRQQFMRAAFSLPMVVEEEARKHEGTVRRLYSEARGTANQGGQMVRDAAGYVHDNIPPDQRQYSGQAPQYQQQQRYQQQQYPQQQRQQYPQQQQQYQSQGYLPLNEGERVVYMPTPQEQAQQARFRTAQ